MQRQNIWLFIESYGILGMRKKEDPMKLREILRRPEPWGVLIMIVVAGLFFFVMLVGKNLVITVITGIFTILFVYDLIAWLEKRNKEEQDELQKAKETD